MYALYKVMRFTLLALLLLLNFPSFGQQYPGGSKNKKASELFGQAMRANDYLEYEKALGLLDKALKKDAYFLDAWLLKGDIHQRIGQKDKALEAYQSLLSIQPENKFAIYECGKVLSSLQRYDEALRFLNQLRSRRDLGNLQSKFELLHQNAVFASESMKHPVPFDPVNMGPNINTEQEEYFPGLTVDEQKLFFTRRDASVPITVQNEDLFISEFRSGLWSEAVNLGEPVNTRENEGAFSTSPDGRYLFFTACMRPGGLGRCDIWVTWKENDQWVKPLNIGAPINTKHWESQPTIAPDGVTIYFASDRPDGYGGSDIWKSTRTDRGWSEPENLGPEINTPQDEEFPFIHPDGQTLYFTSTGHPGMGNRDIFVTRKTTGGWEVPVNLGYPINQYGDEYNFIVNRKGDKAYFATNSRTDGFGGMDIYEMKLYEAVRPVVVSYVKGNIYDAETRQKLTAQVELMRLSDGELISSTYSEKRTGEFLIPLPSNDRYAFKVEADGYLLYSANFSLEKTSRDEPYILDIPLKKIKINEDMVLENIFFETNKFELLPDSKAELNYFAGFLKKNPMIKIEISGHTDNIGSVSANQILSEKRARSVYDHLIDLGIDDSRISFKGYGDKKPRDSNDTEEGRANNRRTEFKITGIQ